MMKCMPFWKGCNRNVDYIDQSHRCLTVVPDEVLRYTRTLEELLLDSNQIRELQPSFFCLNQLRKLSLSDNQISRLSNDIGNLTNLQELDLSHNDLMVIPENIGKCKSLQIVDFSSNPLKDLPEGLTQLKNLTHLILNDVAIRKLPEDIGSLTNLESLELRDNLISQFPASVSQLVNLLFLDAGSNMIEEVPDFIGSLCKLEELRLDCNEILDLPPEVGQLKKLTQLDISENKLERLPQEIGGLASLTDLHLSQNQLEYLPDGIGLLHKLCTLKVDQNHLVQLTPNIGNCGALQELNLTENLLTELPATIGKLKSLTILNVDRNRLNNIPAKIGGCVKLGVLSLRDNCLWHLPPELGFLKELHVLDVSGNRLQHLPLSLGTCNLKALWLSENQAQPLLKFQQDVDEETGEKVLTCFLLPQQAFTDSMENLLKDSFAVMSDHDSRFSWLDHTRGSVKFAEDDRALDSEEEEMNKKSPPPGYDENHFVRHNTPHPKDLRIRHKGLFIKDVDGHMIPHKQRKELDSGVILSNDLDSSATLRRDSVQEVNSLATEGQGTAYDTAAEERTTYDTAEENVSLNNTLAENRWDEKDGHRAQKRENQSHDRDGCENGVSKTSVSSEGTPASRPMTVHIVRSVGVGLGISIAGGLGSCPFVDEDEGIFVSKVNPGGVAEEAGLRVGDKILSVNDIRLVDVEHSRAVAVLRTAGYDITLVIVRRLPEPKMQKPVPKQDSDGSQNVANGVQSMDTKTLDNNASCLSESSATLRIIESSGSTVVGGSKKEEKEMKNSPRLPLIQVLPKPQVDKTLVAVSDSAAGVYDGKETGNSLTTKAGSALSSSFVGQMKTGVTSALQSISNSSPSAKQAHHQEPDAVQPALQLTANRSPQQQQQQQSSLSALTQVNGGTRTGGLSPKNQAKNEPSPQLKNVSPNSSRVITSQSLLRALNLTSNHSSLLASDVYPRERVVIVKAGGPLGLSIVGGRGHTSHPFGMEEPGIFISKIQSHGTAAKTGKLRIGDRILSVNGESMEEASHQEAVMALIAPSHETILEVRHDPQPSGLQEIIINKAPGERLGLSITGGAGTPCGNVTDITDEGIFISRIIASTVSARDCRLSVGMRILEVNGQSLLGTTQQEAAQLLQAAGNSLSLLVCDGFDIAQSKSETSARTSSLQQESEILTTPRLNSTLSLSSSASSGTAAKASTDKKSQVTDASPGVGRSLSSDVRANDLLKNKTNDKAKAEETVANDLNLSQKRQQEEKSSSFHDISSESASSAEKGLSAEEERRLRAEQRKLARLKFLEEAASRTQETSSKVLLEFPRNSLKH